MEYCVIHSPVGPLTLVSDGQALKRIEFGTKIPEGAASVQTVLLSKAAAELEEYFLGKRREFDLPLAPVGTAFQKQVWEALRSIPYGQTRSYSQISEEIGRPGASRAVGTANNRNPIPIMIPCHRVVGADGSLTGYTGGLERKRTLLAIEMGGVTDEALAAEAEKVRENAYAPYSHYQVGAALLGQNGKIYTGCNVENVSYGATICAERAAVAAAVADGCRDFQRLAVISSGEGVCMPCGICRQVLSEFSGDLRVLCCRADGSFEHHTLSELLPFGFQKE